VHVQDTIYPLHVLLKHLVVQNILKPRQIHCLGIAKLKLVQHIAGEHCYICNRRYKTIKKKEPVPYSINSCHKNNNKTMNNREWDRLYNQASEEKKGWEKTTRREKQPKVLHNGICKEGNVNSWKGADGYEIQSTFYYLVHCFDR